MRIIYAFLVLILINQPFFAQTDTTIYSSDRKDQFNGQVLNGKQIGIWKELDSDGTLIRKIQILDNKGNCIITPNFKDTTYSGYYHGYFIQNKVILNGKSEITNVQRGEKKEGYFSYGRKTGQWRTYKNDVLIEIEYYEKNKNEYLTIPFENTGKIIRVMGINEDGQHSGLFVDFDDSNKVSVVGYFENGCKIGEWSYYTNGVLTSKGSYYPDFLHLKSINDTLYLVNKNDSLAKEIYPLDVVKSFDINEQVLYLKHGKWYYFDSLGNVVKTECYEKGKLILDKKRKKK
jgi:antitoxin component YwqK of YwqJK toxin-antitoxin module